MSVPVKCLWCDKEAVNLCDAAIGGKAAAGMNGKWVYEMAIFTCDAPMCSEHTTVKGHICGKGGCDFIEWCPYCVENEAKFQPMFEHEAETVRRARHAEVRRSMLRVSVRVNADNTTAEQRGD